MHNIEQLKALLSEPKKVVITTHPKPDADALGSSLALFLYLKKKNHVVHVIVPTDYPSFLNWMHEQKSVSVFDNQKSKSIIENADFVFCLDFSSLSRINDDGLGDMIAKSSAQKVLIDHHLEPENFATYELWDSSASSTAELIYDFICLMGEKSLIDVPIGECIYAGIMTDTGSFRFRSTTAKVHLAIAELLTIGVDNAKIHRLIYDNNSESKLRFLGYSLQEKLKVLHDFKVAYFTINSNELNRFNSQNGDTEGLVNYALSLQNIEMAVIMIEREGLVKLSFRSSGDFSVNSFARKHFSGGGHKNAAGGKSELNLKETENKFLEILQHYKQDLNN